MEKLVIPSDRCTGKSTVICMSIITEAMQKPNTPIELRDHFVAHSSFSYAKCLRHGTKYMVQDFIDRLGFIGFSWSSKVSSSHPYLIYTPPKQEELLEILFNK